MVNERHDEEHYEAHEEGEYHFSDDELNYDLDAELKDSPVIAADKSKEEWLAKLKKSRRIMIGIVIFVILLGIVYRMVAPTSTKPATDFDQQASTTTTTTTKTTPSLQPTTPAPSEQGMLTPSNAPMVTAQSTPMTNSAEPTQTQTNAAPQPAASLASDMQQKNILDRLAYLEQQNAALTNLIQTQYTQKISAYEMQNTDLKTQVQELNARIASMEVAFHQFTKLLKNMNKPATPPPLYDGGLPARPKISYTVQAIIPGRAWLKSDAGDTVTVAEGDILRGLGRITKIDPYDGIVNIDTGNRIVTLSYGNNGDD